MASFDKSYYDLLNKYQHIKEGMSVRPTYFKKVGNNFVPVENNMDLARINPNEIFVSSGDANNPYIPYTQATQQSQPTGGGQPSISVTGDAQAGSSVVAPDSGPQTSVASKTGQRVQYQTPTTTSAPQQTVSTSQTPSKSVKSAIKSPLGTNKPPRPASRAPLS